MPAKNLQEILQQALTPYGDKLAEDLHQDSFVFGGEVRKILAMERKIGRHAEDFLPSEFRRKEFSRLRSIYAFPFAFPSEWYYPNLVPKNVSFAKGESVLRLAVDWERALVFPVHLISELYRLPRFGNNGEVLRMIREYLGSAVSLREFTEDFENPDPRNYLWYSKTDRRRMYNPEVIIPESSLGDVSVLLEGIEEE